MTNAIDRARSLAELHHDAEIRECLRALIAECERLASKPDAQLHTIVAVRTALGEPESPTRPGWRRNHAREGGDWDEAWVHTSGVQVLHDAVGHDWQAWTVEDRDGVFKPFGGVWRAWEDAARDAMAAVNVPAEPDSPDGLLHDRIHPTSGRLIAAAPIMPDKAADPHGLGVDTNALREAWDCTVNGGATTREGVIAMLLEYDRQKVG